MYAHLFAVGRLGEKNIWITGQLPRTRSGCDRPVQVGSAQDNL